MMDNYEAENEGEDDHGPEPRITLCASLRSQNAPQHVTLATFYGNLKEKGSRSERAP